MHHTTQYTGITGPPEKARIGGRVLTMTIIKFNVMIGHPTWLGLRLRLSHMPI